MTEARLDLLGALWQIQNHPLFRATDIVTNAASPKVSDQQVRNHIESCLRAIAKESVR